MGAFARLVKTLEKRKDVRDPEALAAWLGREKLGAGKMSSLAAKGKRKAARKATVRRQRRATARRARRYPAL